MTISLLVLFVAGLLGLLMGSFSGAQVWRLRARQLVQDKAEGEDYDKAEYKRLEKLTKHKMSDDRSRCLSCNHTLAWYDLIPLVSWISTNGKCRYCRKPIGRFEPVIEIATAIAFVVFSYFWIGSFGTGIAACGLLILWLIALTMLVILFAYDLKWFLLPDVVMFPLIGLAVAINVLHVLTLHDVPDLIGALGSTFASIGILAGLYFVLWLYSKGMWVGFGDVKLGVVLGILLIDWRLAFLTLFLANLIGTIIVLPGLLRGRLSRKTQIPFGPLLILGFFISAVAGPAILAGYMTFSTWLSSVMLML